MASTASHSSAEVGLAADAVEPVLDEIVSHAGEELEDQTESETDSDEDEEDATKKETDKPRRVRPSSLIRKDEAQKYATMATLAPLVTLLFSFVAFNEDNTSRISCIFYIVTACGISTAFYGLRQNYHSRRTWGLDTEDGIFAHTIRVKLRAVELSEKEAKDRFPILALHIKGLNNPGNEEAKQRFQYEARKYCHAARRAARTAKCYFSSLAEEGIVSSRFRHVAGSEVETAERVILIVDELIGRENGNLGRFNMFNFWRILRYTKEQDAFPRLRRDLRFDADKIYWKIREIADTIDELEQTLKKGEDWNLARRRFKKLDKMTKTSLRSRAVFTLVLAQLALNMATILAGTTKTQGSSS